MTVSVSRVTACTTSRPAGRSADQQTSSTCGVGAAADEDRVRSRQVGQGVRRGAVDDPQPGHAELGGVGGDPLGPVMVPLDGDGPAARMARDHSMPIEPAPAPTSQSSSPGRGIRWASAEARTSRLVSWPSCSYASSGRPAARLAYGAVAPDLDADHVERGHRLVDGVPGLVGRAQVAEHGHALSPMAGLGQQRGRPRPGLAASRERTIDPLTGEQPAAELVQIVLGAQPDSLDGLGRPAHPSPGQGTGTIRQDGFVPSRTETSRAQSSPTPASRGSPLASTTVGPRLVPGEQLRQPARSSVGNGSRRWPGTAGSSSSCAAPADHQLGRPRPDRARPDPASPSRPRRSRPPRSRLRPYAPDGARDQLTVARSSRPAVPTDRPPSTGSTCPVTQAASAEPR